ncbi:conserved hypothetical protein [Histoplasma capsulatum var. duboisii H88]|uniref:HNH nuclease domain-containing protein n=1 Tax=Ajellomyces capsulatus (strain H88) TaxID=544711 RepID=F0USW4_AJEC8|nr:conserved hypothetical protein [Histoplasma capsulatum var. duboisii H88]
MLWILENILLVAGNPWTVRCKHSNCSITATDIILAPGDYEVHSSGMFYAALTIHLMIIPQSDISHTAQYGIWAPFEAAHIFPLEYENIWIEHNYGRRITDTDDAVDISKINSVQNGLLMDGGLNILLNQYIFSVNPDDTGLNGRILDPVCHDQEDPHRVSAEVLRRHFRQTILANMRGVGEPIFEHDFPPGTAMIETGRGEPYGKERFEVALATRLQGYSRSNGNDHEGNFIGLLILSWLPWHLTDRWLVAFARSLIELKIALIQLFNSADSLSGGLSPGNAKK